MYADLKTKERKRRISSGDRGDIYLVIMKQKKTYLYSMVDFFVFFYEII